MSRPWKQCFLLLALLRTVTALPQGSTETADEDDSIVDTVPSTSTIIIAATQTGPPSEVTVDATPIPSSNSYWWIDNTCGGKTNDGTAYKSDFLLEAYKDATILAKNAKDWPSKYTEASDMYVGKDFHKSKYAQDFKANLAAAGAWDTSNPLPFQSYIRVTCGDPDHACRGRIGNDPRSIIAYANNTKGTLWGEYWTITVCDLFFTLNTINSVHRFWESYPTSDLQMIYMETSGEKFLHEAMHLNAITETREHIVDQTFDGGRRIYGPQDVAKAARITKTDGFSLNYKNADTYAMFAQAAYWQKIYGFVVPPVVKNAVVPAGATEVDGVQDSSDNYVELVEVIGDGPEPADSQQVALASYINPLADPSAWSRIISYDKSKVSVLVANIVNGPDTTADKDWANVIDEAVASGKRVIGYVRTGYLGVSQQQFKTRLGSGDLADWTAQIEEDVDLWYSLYPGKIGGIFFDEGWNDCGTDNMYAELYRQINENTKRKYPDAYTILNPGDSMPQCFEHSADTLLTFESSYERYIDDSIYKPNGWDAADPRKIWHIVYNVPQAELGHIASLAKQRGAGYIELTDDIMPNPYDNLPSDSYMQNLMSAVSGGSPLVSDPLPRSGSGTSPSSLPQVLTVTAFDYSSVSLSWSSVTGAAGFKVKINDGTDYLSLPSSMTRATVGSLSDGAEYSFTVIPIAPDGTEWSSTVTQTVTTKSLPGGKTVSNAGYSGSAGSSTYKADILVPYAFNRLYIWNSEYECDWDRSPGWPVNYNQWGYCCAQYMVEGDILYKYSGVIGTDTTNAPWAWTQVGAVTVEQTGYTYKWTLPIGTSTIDASQFIIQVQGYGPTASVFQPCPGYAGPPVSPYGYCS